uniref:Uncharacterized protein n=1 Tax=Rhizophora mucronata TaxID=61149 RepID=A0A2P2K9K0_RHIMU
MMCLFLNHLRLLLLKVRLLLL